MISTERSHPSRGAWIEITPWEWKPNKVVSHPSRGAWIEIAPRTPHCQPGTSHPSRGAWIEIPSNMMEKNLHASHPSRGAWIEIKVAENNYTKGYCRTPHGVRGLKSLIPVPIATAQSSHPSRGAWIEMLGAPLTLNRAVVAPLTGCVD